MMYGVVGGFTIEYRITDRTINTTTANPARKVHLITHRKGLIRTCSLGVAFFGFFFAAGFFFTVFLATPNHTRAVQGGATPPFRDIAHHSDNTISLPLLFTVRHQWF